MYNEFSVVAWWTWLLGSTRGLDGGIFGGETTDRVGIGDFDLLVGGIIAVAGCVGAFFTFTPTVGPRTRSACPPLRRNSEALNRFSLSPSASTRMSQELARVKRLDAETEESKVEFEFEDRVDLRVLLCQALSVDKLEAEGDLHNTESRTVAEMYQDALELA
ncbi:hypothetical protein DEU56DRAFT_904001 [Suillus clintonianus]|uniref:uncharacterized protein n=1 Tax=Suillus clintonianus TaxID=1904413 RepID=UPI001B866E33|nr:uncharacterized protein DEU56DRAFT_904001 [Suillus clintonianus]KAG2124208.1 hypothetical protein DEU56DRAFT_904001 [Suillus clintonianus]